MGPMGSERAVHRSHLGPSGDGEKALRREGGNKMHMSLMTELLLRICPRLFIHIQRKPKHRRMKVTLLGPSDILN